MTDPLGREIEHLRISLTNRCNLDCFYCHQEGNNTEEEMETGDVFGRMEEARKSGIRTIKFTGGEPLMREDILEILQKAGELGYEDISMTTNGTMLAGNAGKLKNAGLQRVNIGCDSIASLPKNLSDQKKEILEARSAGLGVKLNMVVMKENEHEVWHILDFCRAYRVNLQLIELIDLGNRVFREHYSSLQEIEKRLGESADSTQKRRMQARKRFFIQGIYVETVRPGKDFCKSCHKIRVTASGQVKPCLINKKTYDSVQSGIMSREAYGYC